MISVISSAVILVTFIVVCMVVAHRDFRRSRQLREKSNRAVMSVVSEVNDQHHTVYGRAASELFRPEDTKS